MGRSTRCASGGSSGSSGRRSQKSPRSRPGRPRSQPSGTATPGTPRSRDASVPASTAWRGSCAWPPALVGGGGLAFAESILDPAELEILNATPTPGRIRGQRHHPGLEWRHSAATGATPPSTSRTTTSPRAIEVTLAVTSGTESRASARLLPRWPLGGLWTRLLAIRTDTASRGGWR